MVLKSKRKIFSREQKVVLITGASSGLGFELAKKFAMGNFLVLVVARRKDRLNDLSKSFPDGKMIPFEVDLNNENSVQKLVERVFSEFGKVDILINNAAWGKVADFKENSFGDIEGMIKVNCLAPVYLIRLILPEMLKKNKGKIINISSTGGVTSLNKMAVYGATKHFINGLTKNLYWELKGTGVSICTFMPGSMSTEFSKVATGRFSEGGESAVKVAGVIYDHIGTSRPFVYPTLRSYVTVFFNKVMSLFGLR